MDIPLIIKTDNILTFIKPSGKSLSLMIGDIVKAEVLEVMDSGTVSLRIVPQGDKGGTILAKSNVPLTKGENILLKVVGGDKEITLQLIGTSKESVLLSHAPTEDIPKIILKMLSEFSDSRLRKTDINLLRNVVKSLPERIKTLYPELRAIEKLMPEIEKLSAGLLKTSVERSGVIFETRLKLAAMQELVQTTDGVTKSLLAEIFDSEPDLKGLLLKIKAIMENGKIIDAVKASGINYREINDTVERLVKNIEFFQLTSKINDMLYTFLPISWYELKDGELLFKKNRKNGKQSYTCTINLDLERFGKMSVSVTLLEGTFYVTFFAEKPEVKSLLFSEKGKLEKRFTDAGLPLKTITVGQKKEIIFGETEQKSLDVRV